jgi:hypothetical protein
MTPACDELANDLSKLEMDGHLNNARSANTQHKIPNLIYIQDQISALVPSKTNFYPRVARKLQGNSYRKLGRNREGLLVSGVALSFLLISLNRKGIRGKQSKLRRFQRVFK